MNQRWQSANFRAPNGAQVQRPKGRLGEIAVLDDI
jgi:hypothetical protein